MKPILLEMEAFGPFGGKQIVDFTKLQDGLYLITGENGAGKTSIFDAITFALYGEPSGQVRKSSMLRSDFAEESAVTRVNFTFSYGDKVYRVTRIPQFERAKLKGEGRITQGAEADLYQYYNGMDSEPDAIASGVKDVGIKIKDIMGINREQFVNVSMIAQGEFLKLLYAKSEDRAKIFREIFKTGVYQRLQEQLKAITRGLENDIKLKKQAIIQYANSSDYGDNKEYEQLLAQGNVNIVPDIELYLRDSIKQDEGELKKTKAAKDKTVKKITGLTEQIAKLQEQYDEYQKIEKRITDNEEGLKNLIPKLSAAKEDYGVLCKQQKKVDEYNVRALQLEGTFPKYEEITQLHTMMNESKQGLDEINEELKKIQATIEATRGEIKKEKEVVDLKSLELEKNNQLKASLDSDYEEMLRQFLAGQAGIMAAALEAGEECPVCGSTSHPKKAKLQAKVCTEEELNSAKKLKDSHEKALIKLSKEIGKLRQALEEKDKKLGEHIKAKDEKEVLVAEKQRIYLNAEATYTAARNQLEFPDLASATKERERILAEAQRLVASQEAGKEKVDKLNNEIAVSEAKLKDDRELLKEKKGNLQDINPLRKEADQLTLMVTEYENNIEVLSIKVNKNKSAVESISKELQEYEQLEKKWGIYSVLSSTADGSAYGQGRFDFEKFVQAKFFEQIIELANLRLGRMTSGRFVLMRRKSALRKGVQTGLDVDVLDNNTGKIRTGESLSGGEAFMASLSLALGMSDVVSASHGGIRLESMFIDEGFGCLSEDSLEKALSVLVELSNSPEGGVARPVGIISHIGLLKERIHNKIQVEKSINGSRIVM